MEKNKRALALCGLIAAFCLGSCLTMTDELDLNKDISLDMQIGPGGLSIPLGSLSRIYLDSLIKIDGDESILDTLDNGLYGFKMEGEIDKVNVSIGDVTINIPKPEIDEITASFDQTDVDDVQIAEKTQNTTLKISSVSLDNINNNLPSINKEFIMEVDEEQKIDVPITGIPIPEIPVIVPLQTKDVDFNYTLPDDVSKLNKVYFGQENTTTGQALALKVDLSSLYDVMDEPKIRVTSLVVTFPTEFTVSANSALDQYISSDYVTVNGNVFSIAMPSEVYLPVIGGDHKLSVLFNMDEADFSAYSSPIDYHKSFSYQLELEVSGTTTKTGQFVPKVDVGINEQLTMRDFSVDTKVKTIDLTPEKISSSYELTGLDNLSRVNYIDFDPSQSTLYLSLSDFDIDPFSFDNSSAITLQFPSSFGFVKGTDDKVYVGENAVGQWKNGNYLDIWPGEAKGKTIELHVDKLTLNQDVDEQKKSITVSNDVNYSGSIKIASETNLGKSALDALTDKNISFKVWGSLVVDNANIETARIETDFEKTTSLSIAEKVDQALVEVNRIDLTKPAGASLQLKFKGVPITVTKMTMSNLTLEFPEFLLIRYVGNDNRVNLSGNKLVIDGDLKRFELDDDGDGFTLTGLQIEGMEFKNPLVLVNDSIKMTDSVSISGSVFIDKQSINSNDLKDIHVTPVVEFDEVVVKSVTGRVDPVIDGVEEDVDLDLGDDIDFLKNKDNRLGLSDPMITININSTVTLPIDLDLKLYRLDANGVPTDSIMPDDGIIRLAKCDTAAESRHTTMVIYKNERPVSQSDDTVFVRISHLSDIMSPLPDKIRFALKANVAYTGEPHYLDLTRELSVSGDYKVSVPLSFDSLYIEYSETIEDLGKNLEDIGDKIDAADVELLADVISTIPLGVRLSAVALDNKGNEIKEVQIESSVIGAGNDQGRKTPLKLGVKLQKGGLTKLDAISFTAALMSAEDVDIDIKKGQYIELDKVRLNLPQGLKVDLTDMNKDNKK